MIDKNKYSQVTPEAKLIKRWKRKQNFGILMIYFEVYKDTIVSLEDSHFARSAN